MTGNAQQANEIGVEFCRIGEQVLYLDIRRPDQPLLVPAPVVIYVHGGGWFSGNRADTLSQLLADAGFVAVSIDYRLTGIAPFPAQIHDVKAAIRWVRAHAGALGIDSARIGIWGHSAGGHLALLAGLTADDPGFDDDAGAQNESSSVQCVVTGCARTEFLIDWYAAANIPVPDEAHYSIPALLGGPALDRPDVARAASPYWHLKPDAPPCLMMHGEADDLVPINQARAFVSLSRQLGNTVEFVAIPGAGHDIVSPMYPEIPDPDDLRACTVAFFHRHLVGTEPETRKTASV